MPRVPIENLPQVSPQGLPGPRLSPGAPEGAFGGGQGAAEVFGQAGSLAQDIARQQHEVQQRADLAAVFKANAELSDYVTDLQYNQQTGIVNQKGENAFSLAKTVPEGYRKRVSQIMGSLASSEQRAVFQRHADQSWGQLNGFNQRHIAGQAEHYMAQQADAYVASRQNAASLAGAAGDLNSVEQAANDVDQARRAWALKNGVSADVANLAIMQDKGRVYAGAIGAMLDAGNDLAAKEAFTKYRDQIADPERARLARMVKQESTLGEAYRQVDKIFSTYYDKEEKAGETIVHTHYAPETEEAALEEARKIQDPDVRARAESLTRERWSGLVRSKDAAKKQLMIDAANKIDGMPGDKRSYDNLPASMRNEMTATERKQIQSYAKGDVVTDDSTWYSLMQMSYRDPEQFKNINLLNYASKLSRSDFQEITKEQGKAQKGDGKGNDGFRGIDAIVSGTIANSNLNDKDKERFMRRIDREVKRWKEQPANKGKDIPNEIVEQMTDTMLAKVITDPGWLWDSRDPLYKAESEAEMNNNEKLGKAVSKVSPEDRQRIIGEMKADGVALTELNIMRYHKSLTDSRGKAKNAGK